MLESYHKLGHNCFLQNLFKISIHSSGETVLCILIFIFLDIRQEARGAELNGSKHPPNLMCCLFLCECNFHFFSVIFTHFNFLKFQRFYYHC